MNIRLERGRKEIKWGSREINIKSEKCRNTLKKINKIKMNKIQNY